ncbi:MAG: hypothetical protein AAB588_02110 [Patescibacteria group bacterium]
MTIEQGFVERALECLIDREDLNGRGNTAFDEARNAVTEWLRCYFAELELTAKHDFVPNVMPASFLEGLRTVQLDVVNGSMVPLLSGSRTSSPNIAVVAPGRNFKKHPLKKTLFKAVHGDPEGRFAQVTVLSPGGLCIDENTEGPIARHMPDKKLIIPGDKAMRLYMHLNGGMQVCPMEVGEAEQAPDLYVDGVYVREGLRVNS